MVWAQKEARRANGLVDAAAQRHPFVVDVDNPFLVVFVGNGSAGLVAAFLRGTVGLFF